MMKDYLPILNVKTTPMVGYPPNLVQFKVKIMMNYTEFELVEALHCTVGEVEAPIRSKL